MEGIMEINTIDEQIAHHKAKKLREEFTVGQLKLWMFGGMG